VAAYAMFAVNLHTARLYLRRGVCLGPTHQDLPLWTGASSHLTRGGYEMYLNSDKPWVSV
jgi:hypothetical protein